MHVLWGTTKLNTSQKTHLIQILCLGSNIPKSALWPIIVLTRCFLDNNTPPPPLSACTDQHFKVCKHKPSTCVHFPNFYQNPNPPP